MISICRAATGTGVNVSEAVSVTGGRLGTSVGVSVRGKTGVTVLMAAVDVAVRLGIKTIGVGVKMDGVREGMGVHTGKGCGATFHVPHPVRNNASKMNKTMVLMETSFCRRFGWLTIQLYPAWGD
jgi:hypothetical protein